MEQRELNIESRAVMGSSAARRLRREGIVPGVIYAGGGEARPVQVNEFNFLMSVRGCPAAQLFTLRSQDSEINGEMVLVKDVQKDPLKGRVLHFDLLAIKAGQRITVEVPIELTGESNAVRQGRAIVNQMSYQIEVECLPNAIPDKLMADISNLEPGQTLFASDLPLPDGVELKIEPDAVVVTMLDAGKVAAEADRALSEAGEAEAKPAAAEAAALAAAKKGEG